MSLPPLPPCLHLFVVGTVRLPLHHILEEVDTPQHVAGTPETLRKVASAMRGWNYANCQNRAKHTNPGAGNPFSHRGRTSPQGLDWPHDLGLRGSRC
jgi:hypothetical protein